MDGKFLTTLATYLDTIELYPYVNVCHYLLISYNVRQVSPGNKSFSRQHPLSSWFTTILLCFAGSILSNLLVGEALVTPLKYHENILHATVCWYLVNYFPFDLVFKIVSFLPTMVCLSLVKELYRARNIHIGITVATKRYPDAVLVWLFIGLAKGCGEDIIFPFAQACMGILTASNNFLLSPSFNVKGSLAVAAMFAMEKLQKVPIASSQLFLAALLFLTYFRVSALLVGIKDPFIPFENLICGLFFGGLVDSIREISKGRQQNNTTDRSHNVNGSGDSTDKDDNVKDAFSEHSKFNENDDDDNACNGDDDGVDEITNRKRR